MADKLTPEELDAIQAQHQAACDLFGDGEISESHVREFHLAHADRAALLRHVEALEQEATKREEGWREHVIDLHDKILTLEQEVERLREDYKELCRIRKAEGVDNLANERKLTRLENAMNIAGMSVCDRCGGIDTDCGMAFGKCRATGEGK